MVQWCIEQASSLGAADPGVARAYEILGQNQKIEFPFFWKIWIFSIFDFGDLGPLNSPRGPDQMSEWQFFMIF